MIIDSMFIKGNGFALMKFDEKTYHIMRNGVTEKVFNADNDNDAKMQFTAYLRWI